MSRRLTAGLGNASYSSGRGKQLIRYYPVNRDCISMEIISPLLLVFVWQGAWVRSLQFLQTEPAYNLHFAWTFGQAEISPVICIVFSAKTGALIDYLHEMYEIKCHTFLWWACAESLHLLAVFSIQSVRNWSFWFWQIRSHLEIHYLSFSKISNKLKWPKIISDVFCIM